MWQIAWKAERRGWFAQSTSVPGDILSGKYRGFDLFAGLTAPIFHGGTLTDIHKTITAGVLAKGLRTGDIYSEGTRKVGTREMGDAVVAALKAQR